MKATIASLKKIVLLLLAIVPAMATSSFAYEAQTNNANGVFVTVTPKNLAQYQAAEFDVSLNTHSVDLSQDLTAVAELSDDQGHRYLPSRWEGTPPGSHHRKGTLIFPNLQTPVKSVTLIIHDVAQVPERTFSWQVKP
jgi:hypothetical protein